MSAAENIHATSVPEYSAADTTVGEEELESMLSSEQTYSAPIKNPFEGKWWSPCWVAANEVVEENKPLLEVNGERLLSEGSMLLVKGQPKAGKTTALQAIIAALLLLEYGNIRTPKQNMKVVYIDTEQPRFHTLLGIKRVHDICKREGLDNLSNSFYTFNLRGEDMESRLQIIHEVIMCIHPDVLIVDNIADLIPDYNAIKESRTLVSELVKIMEQEGCAMILVIHTNKGSQYALGTLGGDLEKKAEAILFCENNNRGIITLSGTTRNKPFESFSLSRDENGLPAPCSYTPPAKKQKMTVQEKAAQKQDEAKARITEFVNLLELKPDTVYDYKMCGKKYEEKSGQSYKTGERRIDNGAELGVFELWSENGIKKFSLKDCRSKHFFNPHSTLLTHWTYRTHTPIYKGVCPCPSVLIHKS